MPFPIVIVNNKRTRRKIKSVFESKINCFILLYINIVEPKREGIVMARRKEGPSNTYYETTRGTNKTDPGT